MTKKRIQKLEVAKPAGQPVDEITEIWSLLARTGAASRYLGQRSDGAHQVILSQPTTGLPVAIGLGASVAEAIRSAVAEIRTQGLAI